MLYFGDAGVLNERYGILSNYIKHYNSRRPHQGLNQQSPQGYLPQSKGLIKAKPILGGLFNDYHRDPEGQI